MKVDEGDLKRRYTEMSAEELLSIDREELVYVAQRLYDDEVARRGLQGERVSGDELKEVEEELVRGHAAGRLARTDPITAKRAFRMNAATLLKVAAVSIVVGLAMVGWLLYQQHQRQADRLYQEAAGIGGVFHGTDESISAVKRLASFQGERITAMLLDLASRGTFLGSAIQITAIEALADRKERTAAPVLARLLQPHVVPAVRKAVADALQKIPCADDCIASALHYLERTSQGEANIEDREAPSAGAVGGHDDFWDDIRATFAKDQRAVYDSLFRVLQQQSKSTVRVLAIVYGLGTDAPSKFALNLLSSTRLHDACPALVQSHGLLGMVQYRTKERDDVEATVQAVGCK
jgi:hypothetical protein